MIDWKSKTFPKKYLKHSNCYNMYLLHANMTNRGKRRIVGQTIRNFEHVKTYLQ
jgi:hypothetical protein